ncbi:MAG: ATP-binding cassette domain-containing protein, partial [Lachnospiraceae bacterium]|nr:ATP-binding cassette domain-containing protein [Lachnospiraceae bacterium]
MNTHAVQTIWKITEILQQSEQLEEALSESLDLIIQEVGCEEGSVWMINQEDRRVYAMLNAGKTDITGYSVDLGEGIAGTVAQSGITELVEDASKDPRFSSTVDEETGFVTRSLICVPLKNEFECLGCIQLINKNEALTEEDREICENLAALIAIAIEEKGFAVLPNKDRKAMIVLKNVIKEYGSGEVTNRVLKGIDLEVYEKELLVVLGESGCGKSTMLNIIGGMDTMTSGELTVDGKDMSRPTEKELTEYRRNFVGFIFQNYNLMPNLTAQENIDFIAEISQNPMDSA